MSSDPSGTRLVPMTERDAKILGIHKTWLAAPADPARAIEASLSNIGRYGNSVTKSVLAALGVLANPANEEHHA